jgi:hypothetical protein
MARPALNVLVSKSVWLGCGCQNEVMTSVEAVLVARLRADAVAQALPVVLGRRRDAVAVVAAADLVGALELRPARPSLGQLRVGADPGTARPRCSRRVRWTLFTYWRRQIDLGDRLRQRVFKTSFGMAEIFARTSEPMLPSTRS